MPCVLISVCFKLVHVWIYIKNFQGTFYSLLPWKMQIITCAAQNETQSFPCQILACFSLNIFSGNKLNADLIQYKKIRLLIFLQDDSETSAFSKLYDEKFWIMLCCVTTLAWKVCAYLCVYIKCIDFVKIECQCYDWEIVKNLLSGLINIFKAKLYTLTAPGINFGIPWEHVRNILCFFGFQFS